MKKSVVFSVLLLAFVGFSFSSCSSSKEKDKSCEITSFKVNGEEWFTGSTSITKLVCKTSGTTFTPTILFTGVKIEPASGVQQDFSSSVTYVVTAENGDKKTYTVKVEKSQTPCD